MPQPITQSWEITIPIPFWITNFFHIKRGLLITPDITILAHREIEEFNSFIIKIIFRWRTEEAFLLHPIEDLRIVLGYLWPNWYYQTPEEETAHTPSTVFLATGVTASGFTTLVNPQSSPQSLHEVPLPEQREELPELPGTADYNRQVAALWERVEEHNRQVQQLLVSVTQRLDNLLTHIWSGGNLDKTAFAEGNITYCQLCNIDWSTSPHLYSELSHHTDDNYEPPCLEDFDSQEEEEGEEESPMPIPDLSGTHSRILPSDTNSEEQSSESMSDRLERHNCGRNVPTEDNTRVRVTLESEHQQNLLNRVADMRTKLPNSYFFLIFILALLHFLTYIHFLCTS